MLFEERLCSRTSSMEPRKARPGSIVLSADPILESVTTLLDFVLVIEDDSK